MKKAWQYAALGAAVAAAFTPFKLKYDPEAGEFEYRSLLLGVSKKPNWQTGEVDTKISLFNSPFKKESDLTDIVAEGESVLIMDESELATVDSAEDTVSDQDLVSDEELVSDEDIVAL